MAVFIDGVPIETSMYSEFSMAMLNNQMVALKLSTGSPCQAASSSSLYAAISQGSRAPLTNVLDICT